jgi:5-oxoprolinase (ATP-hydrolysing) subunit A
VININCDIGERGADHPVDLQLMTLIQIANVACGGHAGDRESVTAFRKLADQNGVKVAAHLSYPDRENFGRQSIDISPENLQAALDDQYQMMPDVKTVKFHGALYNDACVDDQLALNLTEWLLGNGITEVITPFDSLLADSCRKNHILVLAEAFAERRYAWSEETGRLSLVSRKYDFASIHDCDEAVQHAVDIVKNRQVNATIENDAGEIKRKIVPIQAETICIHSDSVIALELAQKLAAAFDTSIT